MWHNLQLPFEGLIICVETTTWQISHPHWLRDCQQQNSTITDITLTTTVADSWAITNTLHDQHSPCSVKLTDTYRSTSTHVACSGVQTMLSMTQDASWIKYCRGKTKKRGDFSLIFHNSFVTLKCSKTHVAYSDVNRYNLLSVVILWSQVTAVSTDWSF